MCADPSLILVGISLSINTEIAFEEKHISYVFFICQYAIIKEIPVINKRFSKTLKWD
jgi:hypothetical protein